MVTPKPTPEELAAEDQESSPSGVFNYAETYRKAAEALRATKYRATHSDSPILFLYYHAIELYLKAFLRANGIHAYDLRVNYRHGVGQLSRNAAKLGMPFTEEEEAVFHHMSTTRDVIQSRYLKTGLVRRVDQRVLDRTCESLRVSVAKGLRAKGHPARL
jgi:HEPN domain-containing protein